MSRMRQKRKLAATAGSPRESTLIERIEKQIDVRRLAELHYWSREPGLLETIRAIVAMPPASKVALATFVEIAGDPESIAAKVDGRGNLTLTSPHIAEALAELSAAQPKCIEIAPDVAQRIH